MSLAKWYTPPPPLPPLGEPTVVLPPSGMLSRGCDYDLFHLPPLGAGRQVFTKSPLDGNEFSIRQGLYDRGRPLGF